MQLLTTRNLTRFALWLAGPARNSTFRYVVKSRQRVEKRLRTNDKDTTMSYDTSLFGAGRTEPVNDFETAQLRI
jgi:hypothetical protein